MRSIPIQGAKLANGGQMVIELPATCIECQVAIQASPTGLSVGHCAPADMPRCVAAGLAPDRRLFAADLAVNDVYAWLESRHVARVSATWAPRFWECPHELLHDEAAVRCGLCRAGVSAAFMVQMGLADGVEPAVIFDRLVRQQAVKDGALDG